MHLGVRALIDYSLSRSGGETIRLNPPASARDIAVLEQVLGTPLPADLRAVLQRFDGAVFPSGTLLGVGGAAPTDATIPGVLRQLAGRLDQSFLDSDVLLPFQRTNEGGILAFDRSAGPLADTWPVVDYFERTSEVRMVHRTFDGWCRMCVAEWQAPDFEASFTLDRYLAQGERHVGIEPDVASAHATVAHAKRRHGLPHEAVASYLNAARCSPPLPWCDWEALKIAAILDDDEGAFEAASRLAAPGPASRWASRETTAVKVADVIAVIARRAHSNDAWLTLLGQLARNTGHKGEEHHIQTLRFSLLVGDNTPPARHARGDILSWIGKPSWETFTRAYNGGTIRDEDMLFEPELRPFLDDGTLARLLRVRREF